MDRADELITWIEAAEQCQQTSLRLTCMAQLAQLLMAQAPTGNALASSMADAAQLERCDKGTLVQLLGLVAAASRQLAPSEGLLAYKAPADGDIAAAIEQAANPGSFEWRIEQFSQQPAQPGSKLSSPWFMAGGREWQLTLYPNGSSQESDGHVSRKWQSISLQASAWERGMRKRGVLERSACPVGMMCVANRVHPTSLHLPSWLRAVFVAPKQSRDYVAVTFTLCDQAAAQPQHYIRTFEHLLAGGGAGYNKLMSLQDLRARPGYLAGDTLVIRAELQVLL